MKRLSPYPLNTQKVLRKVSSLGSQEIELEEDIEEVPEEDLEFLEDVFNDILV